MNIQIQSVKFDADEKLVDFVETKMSKLDKFSERIVSSDVIMKVDKDHEKGNKVATITLYVPGEDLVAEGRARSFEEAVDEAIEILKRGIVKQKEKVGAF
ncbi:MAG: ribosome-associated translation inhibitor RaiA [Alistipes sp.]|jgi:putative sigma-54 modulation protein|nr:ribosome-associated translation inhibitor RaiA [Alistipes sp.]